MPRDHNINESREFVGEVLSSLVIILLSLGSIGLMELEIMAFVISVPIPIPFPIPIPMLRFQCRDLQMALFLYFIKEINQPFCNLVMTC